MEWGKERRWNLNKGKSETLTGIFGNDLHIWYLLLRLVLVLAVVGIVREIVVLVLQISSHVCDIVGRIIKLMINKLMIIRTVIVTEGKSIVYLQNLLLPIYSSRTLHVCTHYYYF